MENEKKKRRSPFKRLLRALLSITITVLILLGGAFTYLYTNQEQLRGALVGQVNEYLDADVKVGDIRMDFFSQFPDVSFRFGEVFCKEVIPATSNDTLFYFKAVYFEFNLWQLIQSEYELKGITFDDGNLELRMYANGTDNYHFWKESADTTESGLKLALDDVKFSNTSISIETPDLFTSLEADQLDLHGMVQSGNFSSSLKWKGRMNAFIMEEVDWLPKRDVFAEIDFRTSADSTFIENGVVEIQTLRFNANGAMTGDDQHWKLNGSELDLGQFITLIPSQFIPDKSLVDADGQFDLAIRLDLEDEKLLLTADTRMNNGQLDLKKSGLHLSNLQFDGHFDNGVRGRLEDANLRIEHIHATTSTGLLTADLNIKNFISPTVATTGEIEMDFREALTLAETDFWEIAEGKLSGTFNIRKRYTNFGDIQKSGLTSAYMKGSLVLSDSRLKVVESGLDMNNLSAQLEMEGANIQVVQLKFTSGSSDFTANGVIQNAIIFGQTPMPKFNLNLSANHLNLDDIFAWQLDHRKEVESTAEPFRFDFNVNLKVGEFEHREFTARNVSGKFYSEGRDIVATDLKFEACGGSMDTRFRWHPDGPVSQLTTRGSLKDMDIHQLFTEFNNFGQQSLTADNIYGKVKADFAISIYFNDEMEPQISSLISETDLTIKEGRLVNYAPLEQLSRFADASELRDVRFATLENHLSIADQNIHIPGMTVKSNVLELWVQGDHRFDDYIDYSLKLKLLDALGTRRQTSRELADFIQESSREQPQIPIKIVGPLDNLTITIDRTLLGEGIRDEWKGQGQELRDLIEGKEDPTATEPEYIFEWNDERDTSRGR
ncbi:MAG: hypothetical protein EP346_00575 [Bacteroidetes bacterium]|nr:MAG: hypothetical protein EP346_00575 [Bacteroidota bacterium]